MLEKIYFYMVLLQIFIELWIFADKDKWFVKCKWTSFVARCSALNAILYVSVVWLIPTRFTMSTCESLSSPMTSLHYVKDVHSVSSIHFDFLELFMDAEPAFLSHSTRSLILSSVMFLHNFRELKNLQTWYFTFSHWLKRGLYQN